MLIRNESKVCNWIHIKLVFDDGSINELDIHETDYVRVEYRKNGCKKSVTGAIVAINPYMKKCGCNNKILSATIKVDASREFNCEVVSFDMSDIINITKLIPVKCCCCHCGNIENDKPSDDNTDDNENTDKPSDDNTDDNENTDKPSDNTDDGENNDNTSDDGIIDDGNNNENIEDDNNSSDNEGDEENGQEEA